MKNDLPEWTVLVEMAERLGGSLKRIGSRDDGHDRAAGPTKWNSTKPRLPRVSRCRQTIERSGAALSFSIFLSFQEGLETKHEERS